MRNLTWKQWVRMVLGVLLAADAGLFFWNASARAENPRSQMEQRDRLRRQHELLGGDVRLAADIRDRLPEVEKQCDAFLRERLQPASGGYSAVAEDLNRIATTAGLSSRGIQYKQKELDERGVTEVQVTASVEGGYASLVQFINSLEKSKQFYLLEELTLVESSSNTNVIRLSLQLKTYFRLKK